MLQLLLRRLLPSGNGWRLSLRIPVLIVGLALATTLAASLVAFNRA